MQCRLRRGRCHDLSIGAPNLIFGFPPYAFFISLLLACVFAKTGGRVLALTLVGMVSVIVVVSVASATPDAKHCEDFCGDALTFLLGSFGLVAWFGGVLVSAALRRAFLTAETPSPPCSSW